MFLAPSLFHGLAIEPLSKTLGPLFLFLYNNGASIRVKTESFFKMGFFKRYI